MESKEEPKICSGCNNPVKMAFFTCAGKYYEKDCFKCSKCNELITSTFGHNKGAPLCNNCIEKCACGCGKPFDVTLGSGKKFNKECFKCQLCYSPITNCFQEKENKFTCGTCLEQCSCGCGKPLIGQFQSLSNGRKYLLGCFKCTSCSKAITEKFDSNNGLPICQDCQEKCACGCGKPFNVTLGNGKKYNKECFTCQKCNNPIPGEFKEADGKFTCFDCIDKCQCGCNRPITGNFYTLTTGKKYIFGCLKCKNCNYPIINQDFFEKSGEPYHKDCVEKCQCGCQKAIQGGYVELPNGEKYNKGCVKCDECKMTNLDDDYFVRNLRIICSNCKPKFQKQCYNCQKVIDKDYIGTLDKVYHHDCLKCVKCNKLIDTEQHGSTVPTEGQAFGDPICLDCNSTKLDLPKSGTLSMSKRLSCFDMVKPRLSMSFQGLNIE